MHFLSGLHHKLTALPPKVRPSFWRGASNRLASKYLWLSLLVALIPLVGFASLYDAYFSQLVTRLTEEQLATRMAATQNEFRVFIRERKYELETLSDQFDQPALFENQGRQALSAELENLLRLQMDQRTIYGVVFFDRNDRISWTFPEGLHLEPGPLGKGIQFEGAELVGPSPHSFDHPAWVILRKPESTGTTGEQRGSVGLILRFNSLTEILRNLDQGSAYRVLLRVNDGRVYDVVGQLVKEPVFAHHRLPLLPGWWLYLMQDRELVMSPVERMRYWLILLMGCAVAGLLSLYLSISRRLNRQTGSLIESVEKVAQGDLDTPVTAAEGMEMQRLTQAIEQMRHQLKTFIRSRLETDRQATLGQLAAGLAHDIRNPLTTIRTTIVALSRREKSPDNREMLELVEGEIDRVNEVIEDLLNFARPRQPHAEHIAVEELLSSISTLVSASARQQGVSIDIACPHGLTLWADGGHVRQILMNIILNALDSMSTDGGTIRLDATTAGDEILIAVTDQGQGIPEEVLSHVMEPFFTTKSAGTGLGLAISNVLLRSNAGRMAVISNPGQGTTIQVFLPASTGQE